MLLLCDVSPFTKRFEVPSACLVKKWITKRIFMKQSCAKTNKLEKRGILNTLEKNIFNVLNLHIIKIVC